MARGRMINSKIARNKAINDLSDDTSRLAFTWLITFADVDGRCNGDPAIVRSLVFPRRVDVTIEQMAGYIQEWAGAGLVIWYEAEGDLWIAFPSFEDNQKGLDRRKEPASEIPEPPVAIPDTEEVRTEYVPSTEEVRTEYVPGTPEVRPKRSEVKENRSEVKCAPELSPERDTPHGTDTLASYLFREVDGAGIVLNQSLSERYMDVLKDLQKLPHPREFITAAFQEARKANARPLPQWLGRVTERCLSQGCMPGQWSDNGNGHRARASPAHAAIPEAPTTFRNPISGEVETV